jgi:hypothetical protein
VLRLCVLGRFAVVRLAMVCDVSLCVVTCMDVCMFTWLGILLWYVVLCLDVLQ